jgi:hypothetical protein
MLDFPNANDGVRGMAFIENVVNSSNSNVKWCTRLKSKSSQIQNIKPAVNKI